MTWLQTDITLPVLGLLVYLMAGTILRILAVHRENAIKAYDRIYASRETRRAYLERIQNDPSNISRK